MNKAVSTILMITWVFGIVSCGTGSSEKESAKHTDSSAYTDYPDPRGYLKDCNKMFAFASRMDSILYTQTDIDVPTAKKAIKAFTDYAHYCANDSISPVFLIKTGQVAAAIKNIPQAKLALETVIQQYPKFEGVPAAMLLLAQLYDEADFLNNDEEAKRLYQEIIDKYPNTPEAESAKGAIKLVGLSDKEIIQELKKQAKEQPNVNISIQ